jgi:hypothetical protein
MFTTYKDIINLSLEVSGLIKSLHFDLCLGGAPSNKLGETGRFDTTETLYCKLTKQTVIDVVLEELDHALPDITVLS